MIIIDNGVDNKIDNSSCGHTTDFYRGKTDLPRANSLKISRCKFI